MTLRAPAEFVHQIVGQGTAGEGGRYRICVAGVGEDWDAVARLDTLESSPRPVGTDGADTLYIRWSEPVSIRGRVTVQTTGQPVPGARVSIREGRVRAVTDDEGRFAFRGVGGGPLVLETLGLGYAPRTDTVLAASGAEIDLRITLGEEALELEPIVVTARTPPSTRMRGTRQLGMTAEEVDAVLHRSIDFLSLLRRANIPGLLIRGGEGGTGACIEFLRAAGDCAMLQVFVNGVRVSDPHTFVSTIDPVSVREFVVLRPAFAQFQYMGPLTQNGVLDIVLR
ncbi:MAG: carboxypeptidase-like regulatory domain-containing protein [Longimicrobiales bacterium]|nr:carboxypeptidase-like regulatory domain-containing protein [Longimicrobiales bacterium]